MTIRQWLMKYFPQWFKKMIPTPAPVPVPVPAPTPTPIPTPVTPSGIRATPPGIDQAYMDRNGSSEECSIEPHTGLMVRIAVWCCNADRWQWWLLSSVGNGYIRRVDNNLVFTDYVKNGVQYVCRGWTDYEPQVTEANPRLVATGNTCPYDGSRRYAIIDCWQDATPVSRRSGFFILTAYGICVLVTAGLIVGGMIVKGVKKHRAHYENVPVQVEQVKR